MNWPKVLFETKMSKQAANNLKKLQDDYPIKTRIFDANRMSQTASGGGRTMAAIQRPLAAKKLFWRK